MGAHSKIIAAPVKFISSVSLAINNLATPNTPGTSEKMLNFSQVAIPL